MLSYNIVSTSCQADKGQTDYDQTDLDQTDQDEDQTDQDHYEKNQDWSGQTDQDWIINQNYQQIF